MKKYFLPVAAAFGLLLSGCSSDKEEGGSKEIDVPNPSQLEQEVWADNSAGSSGVTFTTLGAWSSSVAGTGASRADVDWVSIDPDHGDAAGTYTINIILENNYTESDRSATVTIRSGESKIEIGVTQKGVKQDGTVPEKPRLITAITETAVLQSDYYGPGEYKPYRYEFSYDPEDRLSEYHVLYSDDSTFDKYLYSYNLQGEIRLSEVSTGETLTDKIALNESGYAARVNASKGEFLTYDYDADGYLQREIDDDTWLREFTWNSGNLTSVKRTYVDDDEPNVGNLPSGKRSSGDPDDGVTYVFSYSQDENNRANLDLNAFFFGLAEPAWPFIHPKDYYLDIYALTGLTGKRSKNYMVGTSVESYNEVSPSLYRLYTESTVPAVGAVVGADYEWNFEEKAKYTFDAKGYPASFSQKVKMTKSEELYNGEKTYKTPANEFEKQMWEEQFGPGPWFEIGTESKESFAYDTYTYTIHYNR